jgi:hypothetical protein
LGWNATLDEVAEPEILDPRRAARKLALLKPEPLLRVGLSPAAKVLDL